MTSVSITTRVYAMTPDRATPQARRGAVKIWSHQVEKALTSTLSKALGALAPTPGLTEVHVRLGEDGATAQLMRPTGSAPVDAACLAAAQDREVWPAPPPPIEAAEFVVQFEFAPAGTAASQPVIGRAASTRATQALTPR